MVDNRVLTDLLPLPQALGQHVAQGFGPQSVRDIALLWIDTAPGNDPATSPRLSSHFLGESGLANTYLTQQQGTLWMAWCIKRKGKRLLTVGKLGLGGLFGCQQ